MLPVPSKTFWVLLRRVAYRMGHPPPLSIVPLIV